MLRLWILVVSLAVLAFADQASRLYKAGRRAEREGDDLKAYTLITRAAGARPLEKKFRLETERLRVRAAQGLAAMGRLGEALALDPDNRYLRARLQSQDRRGPFELPTEAAIREAEKGVEPVDLKPQPGTRSFNLRGDARSICEQVFRGYGLEVVFDPDVVGAGEGAVTVRFRIEDVEFREALRALMAVTGTFVVPVHERVGLVVKDTQQKRAEFDPMMAALLPIPQAISVEEANEIGRAVQQALDIKRLSVDATRRQVYLRDTVTRVRLAQGLYEELSRRRAEVMLDIELLSASRSSLLNLGLTLPTSFVAVAGAAGQVSLGGGRTLFGIQIPGSNFEANATRSENRLLSSFRVRAVDGLPASMHIGDRFPIVNALFSPIVITDQIRALQGAGEFRQPFPSFTFEDLGLVLKVTPRVHEDREISLAIEAAFRLLSGASLNGIPVIADRKFNSAVRLKEGQTSIVSGLAVLQVARSQSGVAGLSQIPLFGRPLRRNTWQVDENELLITITPRLTSLPPAEQFVQRTFYYGTEVRPLSPLL